MSKTPALGVKRKCLSCDAAFFDLGRTPILCPKCGADFKVVELPHKYTASKFGVTKSRFGAY